MIDRSTCPEFIAGSHRWGRWFTPRKFTGADYERSDSRLEPMPDIEAHRSAYEIRAWALEPGDAIAFSYLTVHGAPANDSAHRRRAFAARWVGDDARFAERHGEVSPPFPGLSERVRPGERLPLDQFPVVFEHAMLKPSS